MASFKPKVFQGPKSICKCGHTGDGFDSEHYDLYITDSKLPRENGLKMGMGVCSITGCDCEKFIWKQWTKKYKNFMESTGK
jgi:hypothetical protein